MVKWSHAWRHECGGGDDEKNQRLGIVAENTRLDMGTLATVAASVEMVEASLVVLVGTMAALVHSDVLQSSAATTVMVNYSCANVSEHRLVAR